MDQFVALFGPLFFWIVVTMYVATAAYIAIMKRPLLKTKMYAWALNLTGWSVLAVVVLEVVILQIRLAYGNSVNPTVVAEIAILALVGIVTAVLARCVQTLEARLTKIETGITD